MYVKIFAGSKYYQAQPPEKIGGILTNAVKVTIISSIQSLIISMIKFSPMRAGGETGKSFYAYGIL